MGRSVEAEQGRYGCLDVLSSCFKKSPKAPRQSPRLATSNTRPAHAQSVETVPGQSDVPLQTITVPEKSSSDVLNSSKTQASLMGDGITLPTRDQPSPDVEQVSDLWKEAFEALDEEYKKSISKNVPSEGDDPVEQLIELVQVQEDRFKDQSAKITVGGRDILWRDFSTRVISLLSAAVDIGIQFAPTPGPVVWSALKVLLKAHASGCESVAAIFGCADRVLRLFNRGAIYEQVFLRSNPDDLDACAKDLRKALIDAYRTALELLDYARKQLGDGVAVRRFFEALWDPHKTKDKLNELEEAEKSLQEVVLACDIKKKHLQDNNSLRLLNRLNDPLRYIDRTVTRILTEMEDDKLMRTLNFISEINVGDQHKFCDWEDSSSSNILWLSGKVGAGKSVLTSNIIDRYLANEYNRDKVDNNFDEGFAFFYYSKNDKNVTDDPVNNILRSFLRQLARVPHYANRVFNDLASLCRNMERDQRAFTPNLCRDKISVLVKALPRTTLVLDSLDELEPQQMQEIISFLVSLVNTSERPVKIFVSSRFSTDICNEINNANNEPTRIDIAEQNQRDIKTFVLEETERIDCHWRNDDIRGKVVETISKDARGMFRWAFLQIEKLVKLISTEDVADQLGKLPVGLTAAYDELYAKPGSHDGIYLQRAVKWVIHAHIPLSTEQLLSAVQLCLADEHGDLALGTRGQRLSEQALEIICQHLIVKDDQGKWAFPHASVQEYFVKKHPALTNDHARIEMAKLSLLALIELYQCPTVTESPDSDRVGHQIEGDEFRTVSEPYPDDSFECYVSRYWISHVRKAQDFAEAVNQISELLKRFMISPDCPRHSTMEYQKWLTYMLKTDRSELNWSIARLWSLDLEPVTNPAFGIVVLGITLYQKEWAKICLELNLEELNAELLKNGADPNITASTRPLCAAAREGHCEIVKLLIHRDAAEILIKSGATVDLHLDNGDGTTPLSVAAYEGALNVIELLLEHGADRNIKSGKYGGILGAAFSGISAMKVVRYLIEEAGLHPRRIIEDLLENHAWVNEHFVVKRYKVSKWLFSRNYLKPEEVRDLAHDMYGEALKPLVETARRIRVP
ncbi:ankyrin protein [Colletotrichum scovillei]|nr:ankyrin protein [Colletotrichum scovillei]